MSEVNANDLRIINTIDDVIHTYKGAGENAMTGIEVELAYFDPKTPDLATMTVAQNEAVKNATNTECCGDFARNEPTSEMLEIGNDPGRPEHLKEIIEDTNAKIDCLTQKAANHGLKRSYFQDLPNKTAQQLLENVVPVERYQAFFAPPRADMTSVAAYFSVCKSNQVSVSYHDTDHMLANLRRLYALAPAIFMLTDNGSGFDEAEPFSGHAGMRHRAALGDRGGCPDYIFSAKTGDEYIQNHVDAVMNNKLFVYYDNEGKLIRLPSGQWESFNSLRSKGLNTATNYYFSESILWPDVKVAALKNKNDEVINHRYEARMIGVGVHQHVSALLIVAGLAFSNSFAEQTDQLLAEFGFNWQDPHATKTNLLNAYKAAREHDGHFLDIAYGNAQMIDFTTKFADLIENAYVGSEMEEETMPITAIARTGCTDAKINRQLFTSLDEAIAFQRDYDPAIFSDTNTCAHLLFKDQLEKSEYTGNRVQMPCGR